MDPSGKRPSVKGRKKTQPSAAYEEKAAAFDTGASVYDEGVEGALGQGDVEDILLPAVSDAQAADGAQQPPSFTLLPPRGRRPAPRVAPTAAGAAPDRGASGSADASLLPAVRPPRSGSSPAEGFEQPSDFFDLGDFGDGSADGSRGSNRLHSAIPLAGRTFSRKSDDRDSRDEPPAPESAPAEAPSSEARPEQFAGSRGQSTSRKATEREKAIVRGRKRKIVFAAIVSACLVAIAVSGLLFWNAYLRYDDVADIQGAWQVADGSMSVVIDGDSIDMPESLSYAYTLDTWKKEISFSFEDLKGSGSYRFTSDRKGLVIRENEGDSALALTLVKISDDTAADPQLGDARIQGASSADAGDGANQDDGSSSDAASTQDGASGDAASGGGGQEAGDDA